MTGMARRQSLCVIISRVVSSHVSRASARKCPYVRCETTLRRAHSVAARRGDRLWQPRHVRPHDADGPKGGEGQSHHALKAPGGQSDGHVCQVYNPSDLMASFVNGWPDRIGPFLPSIEALVEAPPPDGRLVAWHFGLDRSARRFNLRNRLFCLSRTARLGDGKAVWRSLEL